MDLGTQIAALLEHSESCTQPGFSWEAIELPGPGNFLVSADCRGCDASIFDETMTAGEPHEPH